MSTPPDSTQMKDVCNKQEVPVDDIPLTFTTATAKKLMVSNNAERQRLHRISKLIEKKCEMEMHHLANAQKDFLKTSLVWKDKYTKTPEILRRKSKHSERIFDDKNKRLDHSETNRVPAFVPVGTLAPMYKQPQVDLKAKNREMWSKKEMNVPKEIDSLKDCRYLRTKSF